MRRISDASTPGIPSSSLDENSATAEFWDNLHHAFVPISSQDDDAMAIDQASKLDPEVPVLFSQALLVTSSGVMKMNAHRHRFFAQVAGVIPQIGLDDDQVRVCFYDFATLPKCSIIVDFIVQDFERRFFGVGGFHSYNGADFPLNLGAAFPFSLSDAPSILRSLKERRDCGILIAFLGLLRERPGRSGQHVHCSGIDLIHDEDLTWTALDHGIERFLHAVVSCCPAPIGEEHAQVADILSLDIVCVTIAWLTSRIFCSCRYCGNRCCRAVVCPTRTRSVWIVVKSTGDVLRGRCACE